LIVLGNAGASVTAASTSQDADEIRHPTGAELGAMMRKQIEPCWKSSAGGEGKMTVSLWLQLTPDGTVRSAEPIDWARMAAEPAYRAVAERAQQAVLRCSPLRLPPDDHALWKNMILQFETGPEDGG
jgi:hypothetical protein